MLFEIYMTGWRQQKKTENDGPNERRGRRPWTKNWGII